MFTYDPFSCHHPPLPTKFIPAATYVPAEIPQIRIDPQFSQWPLAQTHTTFQVGETYQLAVSRIEGRWRAKSTPTSQNTRCRRQTTEHKRKQKTTYLVPHPPIQAQSSHIAPIPYNSFSSLCSPELRQIVRRDVGPINPPIPRSAKSVSCSAQPTPPSHRSIVRPIGSRRWFVVCPSSPLSPFAWTAGRPPEFEYYCAVRCGEVVIYDEREGVWFNR